ncbi:MAG: hypothetical protein KC418_23755 [Anaerolineales bacterium]|nr:hypothetical protein [Anaerolineales bacterium]MCB8952022.1 pilus assembly protein CpaE [Ardenticatenales bacterium]
MSTDNRPRQAPVIDLALARRLKEAGLVWTPSWHDFFAIPDSGLDDRVFVLSDMTIDVQIQQGWPALTFNGAVEWSLDYVLQADALWLPTESQLRHLLQVRLADAPQPAVTLLCHPDRFECRLALLAGGRAFTALEAVDAYGLALLFLLEGGGA